MNAIPPQAKNDARQIPVIISAALDFSTINAFQTTQPNTLYLFHLSLHY
jgi:hypothetical protein